MTPRRARRIRACTYLTWAAIILLWVAGWWTGHWGLRQAWYLNYLVIGLLDITGVRQIRAGVDYHPIYSVEKGLAGCGFVLLGVLGMTGYTQAAPWTVGLWVALLVATKVLALEFILKRGLTPTRHFVRTEHGLELVPDGETIDRTADRLMAWLRHGYVTTPRREGLREGLGYPANDRWAAEERARMAVRRARASARDELLEGIEVEEEMGG